MKGSKLDADRRERIARKLYGSIALFGQPLEEIDSFCYDDTFCAIVKKFGRNIVFRFSCRSSLFLFGPCSFVRRTAVFMSTHPLFEVIVISTILLNCITLTLPKTTARRDPISRRHFITDRRLPWIPSIEWFYLIIYTLEMLLKVLAKGFLFQKYAYLRNTWNFVDFLVVVIAYVLEILQAIRVRTGYQIADLEFLRTFRVVRAIKVISVIPGLRMIINAMSNAVIPLLEVMFLTLVCICCFAIMALQMFIGKLQQVCVLVKGSLESRIFHADASIEPINPNDPRADFLYAKWVRNQRNWLTRDEPNLEYRPCGNDSGSRPCPEDYTCLQVQGGPNPVAGWTGFDNIFLSILSTFQLVSLDYWERLYELVLSTVGSWGLLFFVVVVFLGSFYLMNLLLAVVARCYEDEVEKEEQGPLNTPQKLAFHRSDSTFSLQDVLNLDLRVMIDYAPTTRAEKEAKARAKVKAHLDSQTEEEKEHRMAATGNLAHAIWSVLGRSVSGRVVMPGQHPIKNESQQQVPDDEASPPDSSDYDEEPRFKITQSDLDEAEAYTTTTRSSIIGTPMDFESSSQNETARSTTPISSSVSTVSTALKDSTPSTASTMSFHGDKQCCRCWCCRDDEFDLEFDRNKERCSYFKGCCVKTTMTDQTKYTRKIPWIFEAIYNRTIEICTLIVEKDAFELTVTAFIIINTVLMSSEYYGMAIWHAKLLIITGHFFTAAFTLEFLIKFSVLRMRYFEDKWNTFDFCVVVITYADSLFDEFFENNFASFRAVRLVRIFKLGQNWVTMKILLGIIVSTFSSLWNLTILLGIIIYIFAIIGMQIFGGQYLPEYFGGETVADEDFPRWNFSDFWHAFMLVFRVVCGEWIEPLWECLATYNTQERSGWKCFFLFLPVLVIGNFIVLNLFLALLLSSFNSEELVAQAEKTSEKTGRIHSLEKAMNLMMLTFGGHGAVGDNLLPGEHEEKEEPQTNIEFKKATQRVRLINRKQIAEEVIAKYEEGLNPLPEKPPDYDSIQEGTYEFIKVPEIDLTSDEENDDDPNDESYSDEDDNPNNDGKDKDNDKDKDKNKEKDKAKNKDKDKSKDKGKDKDDDDDDDDSDESDESEKTKEDEDDDTKPALAPCFPCAYCTRSDFCMNEKWKSTRLVCLKIVTHWTFEWFILVLILGSSITLCFEDIYLERNKRMKLILFLLNNSFTVAFVLEMLLKWVGLGLYKYFTNFWTLLDVTIVLISLMTLGFDLSARSWEVQSKKGATFQSLKALRTLRALRPLRAISRWQGMKVVVNALLYAIPAIFNVLLVCIIFWLMFAIMGIQFFSGKFYKCVDEEGELANLDEVPDVYACCANPKYSWINTIPNFDNIGQAYLSLFQVATFEGWMEIMGAATDIGGVAGRNMQREQTYLSNAFFVTFIVFGAFFTLNLFVGVIIDNFNSLKRKYEGNILEVMLSPGQLKYYTAMNKLGQKRARRMTSRPQNPFLRIIFDLCISRRFEGIMFIVIFVNIIIMACDYVGSGPLTVDILTLIGTLCNLMYIVEAIVKLIGFRINYFTVPWNLFDFTLAIFSILDVIRVQLSSFLPFSPTILRVVRVFRITRVLRLIKAAKGIRKLLYALTVSLPALFNIGALLALITFIYSIIGMALFKDSPIHPPMDDLFSYQTFPKAFLLLFRVMTAAGWNDILNCFMLSETFCGTYRTGICGGRGEPPCVSQGFAVIYHVSFVMVNFLIVINMYIAIILENFDEANRDEEIGIEEEDLEMFYSRWARYDPQATQFLSFSKLSDFLACLEEPFCIPRPNIVAIVAFNLPIARGNKIHCLDVLYSLVRHVLGEEVDTESEIFKKLQEQMEQKFRRQFPERKLLEIISSTRIWKIQHNAAIIIQRYWRAYLARTQEQRKDIPKPKSRRRLGSQGFANAITKIGNFFHMGAEKARMSTVPGPTVRRASLKPDPNRKAESKSGSAIQPPVQRERRRSIAEEVEEINRETRERRASLLPDPMDPGYHGGQNRRRSSAADPQPRRASMGADNKAGPVQQKPGDSKVQVLPKEQRQKRLSMAQAAQDGDHETKKRRGSRLPPEKSSKKLSMAEAVQDKNQETNKRRGSRLPPEKSSKKL